MTPERNGDSYFLSQLILYYPWRCEFDLTTGFSNAEVSYNVKFPHFKSHKKNDFANELTHAIHQIQSYNDVVVNDYIGPVIAPNAEALNDDLPLIEALSDEHEYSVYDVACNVEVVDIPEGEHLRVASDVSAGHDEAEFFLQLMSTSLPDDIYHQKVSSLNKDQIRAFNFVKSHLQQQEPFHLFISGPGGVGKSHVISVIQELIKRVKLGQGVCITAPTGVAAFNISGITLHRAFSLPVQHGAPASYLPLGAERLHAMRQFWFSVNTLIIDEISMVSYEMLVQIHLRLNEIFAITDPNIYFGGLNIIAVGDFHQLPPVHGHFVFSPKVKTAMGKHLWRDFFTMIELTIIERQKGDPDFTELLGHIRIGCPTEDDVNFLINKSKNKSMSPEAISNTFCLFPTIDQCKEHNIGMLQALSSSSTIYTIDAQHAFVDHIAEGRALLSSRPVDSSFIPKDDRECAGLTSQLSVSIGAVVMLCRNIRTSDGLVNGARGVVTGFIWDKQYNKRPAAILIRFFNENVGKLSRSIISPNSVPIYPISAIFYGKRDTTLQRTQFPLCLSWAATIHKVQGLTLPAAAIDIGKRVFSDGMAYVALSRVTSVNGLILLDFHPDSVQRKPDFVLSEMNRLRQSVGEE